MEVEFKNESSESIKKQAVPPLEEIKISVPWGVLCGKWWGSKNQQPILALHGWQDNAGTFDNLAPLLANDYPILCIDLPGHGLSSAYPKGQYYYLFWDGVIIVRRIVKYFEWKKVKLMGHSLGGGIAFLYAASYPDETEFYISLDIASPCVLDIPKLVSTVGDHIDKFLKYENLTLENMPCYNKAEMLDINYQGHNGSITRESSEVMLLRGMQPLNDDIYYFTRDVRLKASALGFFITLDQAMELASRITCSVLNIQGNPGGRATNSFGFSTYDMILDKIKETAKVVDKHVVPGTHHLHLNNAKSIADIIRTFLLNMEALEDPPHC